jgi:hypothetical protein
VQDGQQQQRPISEQAVAGLAMPVRHGYKIDLVDLRAGQPLLQGCVASGLHGGRMGVVWARCGQQRSAVAASFSSLVWLLHSRLGLGLRRRCPCPRRPHHDVAFAFALAFGFGFTFAFAIGRPAPVRLHSGLVILNTYHRARREHVSCSTLSGAWAWLIRLAAAKSPDGCRTFVASVSVLSDDSGARLSRQLDQDSHHLWMQDPARSRGPRQEIALHPQPHSSIPPTSGCGVVCEAWPTVRTLDCRHYYYYYYHHYHC